MTSAPAAIATPRLTGLAPVVDGRTRLVVLGSFPGAASLAAQQYYGHPRNHFWPLVGAVLEVDLASLPYAGRLQAIQRCGLGLWDVYASCRRQGSLDRAIEAAEMNDLARLRDAAPALRHVAHNGGESARALRAVAALGFDAVRLPSSSPANASWSFARKLAAWRAAFARAGLCA